MLFSSKIGIDLGTCSVLVYVKGKGIVLREPSVVAIRKGENITIEAIGEEAYRMVGRTPKDVETIYPLEGGVISDYVYCEKMLKYYLGKTIGRTLFAPTVCVCIPCKITEVERMAIMDTCRNVGAGTVHLIEEPIAAAMGAGIDITRPSGSMVVDIGGGTTDIAVISLSQAVVTGSVRVAGNTFDEDIMRYIRKKYGLLIGLKTAEEIKMEIGSCDTNPAESELLSMKVRGRSVTSGMPREIEFTSREVAEAVYDSVRTLADTVREVLEKTPPELASDVTEHGIMMTGGGSLLRDLDRVVSEVAKVDVFVADDAISCVAIGTGRYVDSLGLGGRRTDGQK